ncbi:MAG: monomethylamine:corrinoid methyltransferase, partial [Thermoproteota archaeon]
MDLLFNILDKTLTGPPIEKRDFEFKLVPKTTRDVLKEYGLEKTFDPENPINTDLKLAEQFYKAGYELALRLGMFCPDTKRRVIFTEEEIKEALRNAP